MFDGMTAAKLAEILAAVEPVELKGLALLRRRSPHARGPVSQGGSWYPRDVSPRTMAAAVSELIEYHQNCANTKFRLGGLPPVASDAPIEEWPL